MPALTSWRTFWLRHLEEQSEFLQICLDNPTPDTDIAALSHAITELCYEVTGYVSMLASSAQSQFEHDRPPAYSYASMLASSAQSQFEHDRPPAYSTNAVTSLLRSDTLRQSGYQSNFGPILVPSLSLDLLQDYISSRSDSGISVDYGAPSTTPAEYHESMEGCSAFRLPDYEGFSRHQSTAREQTKNVGKPARTRRRVNTDDDVVSHNPPLSPLTMHLARIRQDNVGQLSPPLAPREVPRQLDPSAYIRHVSSRFVVDPRVRPSYNTALRTGVLQRNKFPSVRALRRVRSAPRPLTINTNVDVPRTSEHRSAPGIHISETHDWSQVSSGEPSPIDNIATPRKLHCCANALSGCSERLKLAGALHADEPDTPAVSLTSPLSGDLDAEFDRHDLTARRNYVAWANKVQEQLDMDRLDAGVEEKLVLRSPQASAVADSPIYDRNTAMLAARESVNDTNLLLNEGIKDKSTELSTELPTPTRQSVYAKLTTTWTGRFINSRGNEYFCDIDEEYLTDRFNLTGLNAEVQYYQYALDLITDVFDLDCDDDMRDQIEKSARHLYGLVHARYIVTTRGQSKMMEKYKDGDFGKCPRVMCDGHNLLPMGQHDIANASAVKLYCARCEDLYNPKSSRHAAIDGAYFGTSFHNIFFQVYPHLVPSKTQRQYEPRIYGFRVHASAALTRWQAHQRDELKARLRSENMDTSFEEEDRRVAAMADGEANDEGDEGIDDMFEGPMQGLAGRR